MRILLVCLFLLFVSNVRAQSLQLNDESPSADIGILHYLHPDPPHYRLLVGMGQNLGRITEDPLALLVSANYQVGAITLGAQFISSSSTGGAIPRKNFSEGGALVGYAWDNDISSYASKPQFLHLSIAGGAGIATYSERWRRFRGRGVVDSIALTHTNVFQSALAFPIQVQAVYEPWRYIGLGAMLWTDFNSIAPSYGASIVLEARY
jgi:hypothetical protein